MLTTTLPVGFIWVKIKEIFQADMKTLEMLVSPWKEYRLKWDEMLENVEIIRVFSDEVIFSRFEFIFFQVYLIRHLVKKRLTLSARESIDVVKVVQA